MHHVEIVNNNDAWVGFQTKKYIGESTMVDQSFVSKSDNIFTDIKLYNIGCNNHHFREAEWRKPTTAPYNFVCILTFV